MMGCYYSLFMILIIVISNSLSVNAFTTSHSSSLFLSRPNHDLTNNKAGTLAKTSSTLSYRLSLSSSSSRNRKSIIQCNMVESVTLESLNDNNNHEIIGEELSKSIQLWLDNEWMIQNIHVLIGKQCKDTYIQCRLNNDHDLMSIMMKIVDDLTLNWYDIYHQDAFVNPYDISNYVSDYFTTKINTEQEQCNCSSTIY